VNRVPHLRDVLINDHGLQKTGEDVYDYGRSGVIYYDCDPGAEEYVAKYFATAHKWLSHRMGEELQLKCGPPLRCTNHKLVHILRATYLALLRRI
jgi:hypothetical protein